MPRFSSLPHPLPQVRHLAAWYMAEAERRGVGLTAAQARRLARWTHVQRQALIEAEVENLWDRETLPR